MDRRNLKPPVKIALLEKKESEVSHCWKTCQLFSYVLVVISGIATSLSMGSIQTLFNGHCILYADLKVTLVENWTIIDKPQHTASRWGAHTSCNFCQYCPVVSVVFAGVLGMLFVMCGRGGRSSRNLPQVWKIVPPAIMVSLIFLLTHCASVALTFGGFSAFCSSIGSQLNVSSCEDLIGYQWYRYPNATYFYDDVVIAETGATVSLVGWLMGFLILLIRVVTHADFQVISTGTGKSTAAAIAATGTSQPPLGHSLMAQRAISASSPAPNRSCSTGDINDINELQKPPRQLYRKRTMSTGNALSGANSNGVPIPSSSRSDSSHPIVINNHHHLHLHCHCNTTTATSRGERGATNAFIAPSSVPPSPNITLVNEVEPLLPSNSMSAHDTALRKQKLEPT